MIDTTLAVQHADRLHRGVGRMRDWFGRTATLAGAAAAVASTFTSHALAIGIPATIAATGLGIVTTLCPWREGLDKVLSGTATALYAGPGVLLITDLIANQASSGFRWWEPIAAAAWTAGTWMVRPAKFALHLTGQHTDTLTEQPAGLLPTHLAPQLTPADILAVPNTPEGHLQAFWQQAVVGRGIAPGTGIENAAVGGPADFSAHIVAQPGYPVPTIPIASLSAVFNLPEQLISITDVPGHGTGRKQLTVGTQPAPDQGGDLLTKWQTAVAPQAMPGSTITAVRYGTTKGDQA